MRKSVAAAFGALLMLVPALVASGEAVSDESYIDYFDTVSYSGGNGSLDWSSPWVEGGENNGPGSGAIRVVGSGSCHDGRCLELRGGILSQPSIRRQADLSEFVDARLHFRVHLIPAPLLSAGRLYVEVREDGSSWTSVADYGLLAEAGGHSDSVDISGYLGDDFEVRLRLGGQLLLADRVYIDDVEVIGSVPVATTTTTTTTTTPSTTSTSPPTTTSTSTPTGSSPAGSTPSTSPPTSGTGTSAPASPSDSPATTVAPASGPVGTGSSTTVAPGPTTGEDEAGDDSSPPVTGITTPTGPTPGDATASPEDASGALALPDGSGLRLSRVGLLADYTSGMMGDMGMGEIEVLGVSLEADFSMAVEAFEATRLWIAALALVIAAALVSGMDIRRSRRGVAELTAPDLGRGASETEG
jgi:hypothetical protein